MSLEVAQADVRALSGWELADPCNMATRARSNS
jgi:hypothetical protein